MPGGTQSLVLQPQEAEMGGGVRRQDMSSPERTLLSKQLRDQREVRQANLERLRR